MVQCHSWLDGLILTAVVSGTMENIYSVIKLRCVHVMRCSAACLQEVHKPQRAED